MQDVESRFAAIEKQLTFHRIIIGGLLIVLVALVGYGATEGVPDVIRARKFEVVNEEGRAVVVIESWELGGLIRTYPAKGIRWPSVSLSHTDDGDGLLLVENKEGKRLIYAGASGSGNGLLTVSNKEGKRLIYAGADDIGDGLLTVSNKEGKDVIIAGSGPGGGMLVVRNKTEDEVVQLTADEYGMGYVGVFDRHLKGKVIKPR